MDLNNRLFYLSEEIPLTITRDVCLVALKIRLDVFFKQISKIFLSFSKFFNM